ncbi:MAG: hypothetical protein FWD92_06455 [Methanomassiliicoccaceae archaeon]|nr:hypothetical protein [Methanomassiliicoccaceae archaeon]
MFDQTVNELKNSGLIEKDDVVVACMESIIKSILILMAVGFAGGVILGLVGDFIGGMIGGLIIGSLFGYMCGATLKAGRYVIAANNDSVRVFYVNRKTKKYLGLCSTLRREEINGALVKKSAGSCNIILKTASEERRYYTSNMFEKHSQKEEIEKLKTLFESAYNKAY